MVRFASWRKAVGWGRYKKHGFYIAELIGTLEYRLRSEPAVADASLRLSLDAAPQQRGSVDLGNSVAQSWSLGMLRPERLKSGA